MVKAETGIVGNLMMTGKPCIKDLITGRYRRKKTLVADSSPPVSRVDVETDSRQIFGGQTPQPQSEPSDGELLYYTLVKDGALIPRLRRHSWRSSNQGVQRGGKDGQHDGRSTAPSHVESPHTFQHLRETSY